jgi:hypothetical protein
MAWHSPPDRRATRRRNGVTRPRNDITHVGNGVAQPQNGVTQNQQPTGGMAKSGRLQGRGNDGSYRWCGDPQGRGVPGRCRSTRNDGVQRAAPGSRRERDRPTSPPPFNVRLPRRGGRAGGTGAGIWMSSWFTGATPERPWRRGCGCRCAASWPAGRRTGRRRTNESPGNVRRSKKPAHPARHTEHQE